MQFLANEAQTATNASALLLTPCHATPLYSHLHRPLPVRFLDCSPPGWAAAVDCLNRGDPSRAPRGVASVAWQQQPVGLWASVLHAHTKAAMDAAAERNAELNKCLRDARQEQESELADSHTSEVRRHLSENARFDADPLRWLHAEYPADREQHLPSYVILFNTLEPQVASWLQQHGYSPKHSVFQTHFAVDRGHDARVLVYGL